MVAKAIERKNVTMLQMAFSAYNITNATDAVAHISKFHQNLNLSKMDLDKFMDAMEMLGESSYIYPEEMRAIAEDCKRNLNYVLNNSINETSLLEYSEITRYGQKKVIKEAKDNDLEYDKMAQSDIHHYEKMRQSDNQFNSRMNQSDRQFKDRQAQQQKFHDDEMDNENIKQRQNAVDSQRQQFTAMLMQSDVKKANEMQPTMMLVNFYVNDRDRDLNVAQQFVCGVKSKLYAVESSDIINKIITKHVDSDILLKLVKVSTREISFVKDFLLGLDEARLDALSKSRKGSASRIFKALERRAIKGKIRRSLRMENSAKAISALVISAEEAEELKKYENIDIYQPRTIVPIMEKLNLLYFVVVDTTAESVNIITDGETEYESYSFTSLERESSDAAYKKVVNLITKVAR